MSLAKDILPLIPQRAPFVMISTLESCNESSATTTLVISKDNIFVKNDRLTEPALLENIAQTAAARMGYLCQQEYKPVPVGFIGAIQNVKINTLPLVDSKLTTTINIKNQIFNATIIEGKIYEGENLIAQSDMKIFISA